MNRTRKRDFKDKLYEQFARIAKALSSGRRLELLELLAQRERSVESLARETDMSVANTSQHLQILRTAQLVEVRRDKLHANYRLADDRVFEVCSAMRSLAESRLAEIERIVGSFLEDRKRLTAISGDELRRRLKNKSVVVLDVRPIMEFSAGHIKGARSIPVDELESRLKELPRSREIVAYCRGPYCVFADEAVAILHARGYKAARLQEGFPEWKTRGFPVSRAISTEGLRHGV
jgi:rhodanese-related sulfurtransferase